MDVYNTTGWNRYEDEIGMNSLDELYWSVLYVFVPHVAPLRLEASQLLRRTLVTERANGAERLQVELPRYLQEPI